MLEVLFKNQFMENELHAQYDEPGIWCHYNTRCSIKLNKYKEIYKYKYKNTKNKKLSNCTAFGTGQKTSAVVSAVLGIVF